MTPAPENDASSFARISQLQQEIQDLEAEKAATEQRIQQLRAAENLELGVVFPQEIFTSQQDKLRLEVEIQIRKNKINRLNLGYGDGIAAAPLLSCLQ